MKNISSGSCRSWRPPGLSGLLVPASLTALVFVLLFAQSFADDSIQPEETPLVTQSSPKTVKKDLKIPENNLTLTTIKPNVISNVTNSIKINEPIQKEPLDRNNGTTNNSTVIKQEETSEMKSGAKWRGLIVFGSLGLFSFIYLAHKIYRKRSHLRSTDTSFYPNDGGEFKYGILMSNDEDHMEMANRPLTMNDSDDEETEIFHQEHRKFVNNDIFQKSSQNIPTSTQAQVYSDNPVSEIKLPDLNTDTSSEDEDLLDLINNKNVLNESVINNNSKSGKTVKPDNIFSL